MQYYTAQAIDQIIERLLALPEKDPKQQRLDKQASVKRMVRALTTLQERGYTIEDIILSLKGVGFDITTPTLKTYLQRARNRDNNRSGGKRPTPRRAPKTDAPKAEEGEALTAPITSDTRGEPGAKPPGTATDRGGKTSAPSGAAKAVGQVETETSAAGESPQKEPRLRSGKDAFLLKDKASY
jgi:hypothetical protein